MRLLQGVCVWLLVCVVPSFQQQYQQPPPGVPPQQHGQAPVGGQQQVPVQEMQQGGQPGGHAHGHGDHQPGFGKAQVHDAQHIEEHLKDVVKDPKKDMTEEELEFHYFKLHDYDSNNKLDGTEITKAITHFHGDEEEKTEEEKYPQKVFQDHEIANIVDMVLKEDDLNDDGYIEYVEFVTAQRRAREDSAAASPQG